MQRALVAPIKSLQVEDIEIEFKDSLFNVSYLLYHQKVHSIWLRGRITEVNHEHQFFDIDDNLGRSLRIQYCKAYIDLQLNDRDLLKVDNVVSVICSITHLIIGKEAFINFKLNRICKVWDTHTDYWPAKINDWLVHLAKNRPNLNNERNNNFNVSMAFKDRFALTNGMDWDKQGEVMINSSFDRTVYVYSLSKTCVTNVLQSKKHGVELVKFTNEGSRHILCSSGTDCPTVAVRIWDIAENRYIKSFSLNTHLARGVGIQSHPNRNVMLTNGEDGSVSLFSFDNTTAIMSFPSPGASVAAFDSEGVVLGRYVGTTSKLLSLYDMNKLETPFKTFELGQVLKKTEDVISVLFTPNGKYVILGTNFRRLICINSVNGSAIFACCYGQIPASKSRVSEFCYPAISPDSKYLISGCSDKTMKIWNFKGQLVATLKGHEGPPAFVAFNPKKAVISSACVKVAWWHPSQTADKT